MWKLVKLLFAIITVIDVRPIRVIAEDCYLELLSLSFYLDGVGRLLDCMTFLKLLFHLCDSKKT